MISLQEFEQGRAIWNDDPKQIADSHHRQREEGNLGNTSFGSAVEARHSGLFFMTLRQA